jgi:hypothetical protein
MSNFFLRTVRQISVPATRSASGTWLLVGIVLTILSLCARAAFVPVDFSANFNRRLQDNVWGSIGMPASLLSASGRHSLQHSGQRK